MNIRIFALFLIALVFCCTFCLYSTQSLGVEMSVNLQITVFPHGYGYTLAGYGSIANQEINCTVLKWPNSGKNSVNPDLTYLGFPANESNSGSLTFRLVFYLNQKQKVDYIQNITVGHYDVSVLYYFGQVTRGNYNLTANLFAEGSNETQDTANVWLQVC